MDEKAMDLVRDAYCKMTSAASEAHDIDDDQAIDNQHGRWVATQPTHQSDGAFIRMVPGTLPACRGLTCRVE